MKSGLLRKSRLVHQVVRWVVRSKALVTAGFGVSGSAVVHLVRKTGQVVVRWFGSFRPNQRTSPEIRHFLVVGVVQPNQRQFRRPFDYLIGKISHQPKTGALVPPLPLRWLLALDLINRRNDLPPHRRPVQVALVEHGVGFHGGLDSSRITVLLDEGMG